MFVYARNAIDNWDGWLSEAEYLDRMATAPFDYLRQKRIGFSLALKIGWDGDIRTGPFVTGLPTNETSCDGKVIIAWKQDNDGHTFVVSPIKLPWLEDSDGLGPSAWLEYKP